MGRKSVPLLNGKTAKGNYSQAKKPSNGMPRPMFNGKPMRPMQSFKFKSRSR